jgi:hypothetical protein
MSDSSELRAALTLKYKLELVEWVDWASASAKNIREIQQTDCFRILQMTSTDKVHTPD